MEMSRPNQAVTRRSFLSQATTAAAAAAVQMLRIAFKVLAAGAIRPELGFRYAFENGADLICIGRFPEAAHSKREWLA